MYDTEKVYAFLAWAVILMVFLQLDWETAAAFWVVMGSIITLRYLYIRIFERDLLYMSFILGWLGLLWIGTYIL